MPNFNLELFETLILNLAYIHSKHRKLGMFILFQKCQFVYPVNKHKEMRTRLAGTISYKSLYFVHPSLELVHLFLGMQGRSIHQSSSFSIFGQVTCHVFIIKR